LNLAYDKLLSNYAFNCNLRHYLARATSDHAFNATIWDLVGRCRLTPVFCS